MINTLGETNLFITLNETGSFNPKKVLPSLKSVYIVRVTIGLRSFKIFPLQMRGRKFYARKDCVLIVPVKSKGP